MVIRRSAEADMDRPVSHVTDTCADSGRAGRGGILTVTPQRARGCGCIGHPAFPAPSIFKGREILASLGQKRAARTNMCAYVEWAKRPERANARARSACPPFHARGGHGARCAFVHPTAAARVSRAMKPAMRVSPHQHVPELPGVAGV